MPSTLAASESAVSDSVSANQISNWSPPQFGRNGSMSLTGLEDVAAENDDEKAVAQYLPNNAKEARMVKSEPAGTADQVAAAQEPNDDWETMNLTSHLGRDEPPSPAAVAAAPTPPQRNSTLAKLRSNKGIEGSNPKGGNLRGQTPPLAPIVRGQTPPPADSQQVKMVRINSADRRKLMDQATGLPVRDDPAVVLMLMEQEDDRRMMVYATESKEFAQLDSKFRTARKFLESELEMMEKRQALRNRPNGSASNSKRLMRDKFLDDELSRAEKRKQRQKQALQDKEEIHRKAYVRQEAAGEEELEAYYNRNMLPWLKDCREKEAKLTADSDELLARIAEEEEKEREQMGVDLILQTERVEFMSGEGLERKERGSMEESSFGVILRQERAEHAIVVAKLNARKRLQDEETRVRGALHEREGKAARNLVDLESDLARGSNILSERAAREELEKEVAVMRRGILVDEEASVRRPAEAGAEVAHLEGLESLMRGCSEGWGNAHANFLNRACSLGLDEDNERRYEMLDCDVGYGRILLQFFEVLGRIDIQDGRGTLDSLARNEVQEMKDRIGVVGEERSAFQELEMLEERSKPDENEERRGGSDDGEEEEAPSPTYAEQAERREAAPPPPEVREMALQTSDVLEPVPTPPERVDMATGPRTPSDSSGSFAAAPAPVPTVMPGLFSAPPPPPPMATEILEERKEAEEQPRSETPQEEQEEERRESEAPTKEPLKDPSQAAVRIQSMMRMRLGILRMRSAKKKKEEKAREAAELESALVAQSLFRGYSDRKRVGPLLRELRNAKCLQAHLRANLSARLTAQKRANQKATIVQTFVRAGSASMERQKRVASAGNRGEVEAAERIQRAARMRNAKRRREEEAKKKTDRLKLEEEEDAAIVIQSMYRLTRAIQMVRKLKKTQPDVYYLDKEAYMNLELERYMIEEESSWRRSEEEEEAKQRESLWEFWQGGGFGLQRMEISDRLKCTREENAVWRALVEYFRSVIWKQRQVEKAANMWQERFAALMRVESTERSQIGELRNITLRKHWVQLAWGYLRLAIERLEGHESKGRMEAEVEESAGRKDLVEEFLEGSRRQEWQEQLAPKHNEARAKVIKEELYLRMAVEQASEDERWHLEKNFVQAVQKQHHWETTLSAVAPYLSDLEEKERHARDEIIWMWHWNFQRFEEFADRELPRINAFPLTAATIIGGAGMPPAAGSPALNRNRVRPSSEGEARPYGETDVPAFAHTHGFASTMPQGPAGILAARGPSAPMVAGQGQGPPVQAGNAWDSSPKRSIDRITLAQATRLDIAQSQARILLQELEAKEFEKLLTHHRRMSKGKSRAPTVAQMIAATEDQEAWQRRGLESEQDRAWRRVLEAWTEEQRRRY